MNVVACWKTMNDGAEVYVKKWFDETKQPKAIVQLAHGMAEHIERYDAFAQFLVENDIFVYGNDHRGHGKTGEKAGIHGYFADVNGFERVVEDLFEISQSIRSDYANVPLFLMGHSMGSFLARRYIQKYSDLIHGVILSGTGGNPGLAGKIGKYIAKRQMKRFGSKTPSDTLNKLIFGSYNKGFESNTGFEWLTRDQVEVHKYMNDPYCGFVCTSGFFYDLMNGLEVIHLDSEIQRIRKDLPMLIFSGDQDPVGAKTKGLVKTIQQYKNNGITNIDYTFYPEGRHEMLNELNRDEVYKDVLNWIQQQIIE